MLRVRFKQIINSVTHRFRPTHQVFEDEGVDANSDEPPSVLNKAVKKSSRVQARTKYHPFFIWGGFFN